jgi:Holliday junction resolvasome RuvABC endonuclease subunit
MRLMAIDPATVLGFAIGPVGAIPRSGAVRLRKPSQDRDVAAFNCLCFLRDTWVLDKPDLVCVEHFLSPVAQKSADAIILQIEVYGVIVAMCMACGIPYRSVQPATWRKHFCGQANAGERDATKEMVIKRAKALKYIPADCSDNNRADACGIFDYGAATFGRAIPHELVLFGEQAAAE